MSSHDNPVRSTVLRSRANHPEDPAGLHLPDPIISPEHALSPNPEDEALLADSVNLALLLVLDALAPVERVAFVLHDVFHLTFAEIAPVIDRSPAATRRLTSRARRRVQAAPAASASATAPGGLRSQRQLVTAFFDAARAGDLDTLVTLLDPAVDLYADGGRTLPSATAHIRGAAPTAQRAALLRQPGLIIRAVLVNGTPGALVERDNNPVSVMGFTIGHNRITEIHILLAPDRLSRIDFAAFR